MLKVVGMSPIQRHPRSRAGGPAPVALLGIAACSGCLYGPDAPVVPPTRYELVLVGATIPATDPSGNGCRDWDCDYELPRAPDPCVVVQSAFEVGDRTTSVIPDSFSPQWHYIVLHDRTARELTFPVYLRLFDEDSFGANDFIAGFSLQLSPEQITPGRITLTAPVGDETATLTLELILAPGFAPVPDR